MSRTRRSERSSRAPAGGVGTRNSSRAALSASRWSGPRLTRSAVAGKALCRPWSNSLAVGPASRASSTFCAVGGRAQVADHLVELGAVGGEKVDRHGNPACPDRPGGLGRVRDAEGDRYLAGGDRLGRGVDRQPATGQGRQHHHEAAEGCESAGRDHSSSSSKVGSSTTKRAPPPGRSSTQICPPCCFTCCWAMASPRPVPSPRPLRRPLVASREPLEDPLALLWSDTGAGVFDDKVNRIRRGPRQRAESPHPHSAGRSRKGWQKCARNAACRPRCDGKRRQGRTGSARRPRSPARCAR